MQALLAVLIAFIAFCSYLLIDKIRLERKRKQSLRSRIHTDVHTDSEEIADAGFLGGEISVHANGIADFMRGLGIHVDESVRALEVQFARAGLNSVDGPVYYLFFQRIVAIALGVAAGIVILTAHGDDALLHQAIGLFIGVFGVFGPQLYLKNNIVKRTKLLQRAFPDTLDLLLICVESGLSLDAALSRICSELGIAFPDMTMELNRTRLELALLNDRVKALTNLGDRTGMIEFRSLVVALIQSERFGTSLSDTLRVLSEEFRLQRMANAETRAARLPVLMTIPLIFLLMPAFMLIVLGPAFVKVIHRNDPVVDPRQSIHKH